MEKVKMVRTFVRIGKIFFWIIWIDFQDAQNDCQACQDSQKDVRDCCLDEQGSPAGSMYDLHFGHDCY